MNRLINPLFGLASLVVLYSANSVASGFSGELTSGAADVIYTFGFLLFLAWWAYADRRLRRYPAPFEFETFVFFAWPLVIPYYLIQTRRWRGVALAASLYVAYFFPFLLVYGLYAALYGL